MLLIDDDQAQILHRREDAGARADDHARRARADAPPLLGALRVVKRRMQNRDVVAEAVKNWPATAGVSAISGTSSSALAAWRQGRFDGVQIDLGLARPGDAVKQEGPNCRDSRLRGSVRKRPAVSY